MRIRGLQGEIHKIDRRINLKYQYDIDIKPNYLPEMPPFLYIG